MRNVVDIVSFAQLDEAPPQGHLLTNGRFTTLLTAAGGGYAAFEDVALTRWSADRTRDADGYYVYLRDVTRGTCWSAGHQPVQHLPGRYDARFHHGRIELVRRDEVIETNVEVCVAPEADVELRRVTLLNHGEEVCRVELTSYAEVVLNDPAAEAAHPAFSKLFVQTEAQPRYPALLAWRRPRSPEDKPIWLVHSISGSEGMEATVQYETDRMQFIGRGRSPADPCALDPGRRLSGTEGNVLDPVVSLRQELNLAPGERVSLTFVLGAARSRVAVEALARRFSASAAVDEAFQRAADAARAELQHAGLTGEQAHLLQRLACALRYGYSLGGGASEALLRNRRPVSALAPYDFAAGLPLLLVRVGLAESLETVRLLLKARGYWRRRGLGVNVLFVSETDAPPPLHEALLEAVEGASAAPEQGAPGSLLVRRAGDISDEDMLLLQAAARLVIQGALPEKPALASGSSVAPRPPLFQPARGEEGAATPPGFEEPLQAFNGYGGFSGTGDEYVIRLVPAENGQPGWPPLPWANVIANEKAGFLTTEAGAGCAWSGNSRENRLTPWYNDPVTDPLPEALYVRDEEGTCYWSPTPAPVPQAVPYEIRHGFGYTYYRHQSQGLDHAVWQFMDRHHPVKIIRLRLTNRSGRARRLSVFAYFRWVLGGLPEASTWSVVTAYDEATGALLATNVQNHAFAGRVAFAAPVLPESGAVAYTADRTAFLGRHGSLARPAAVMAGGRLEGRAGAGLDPCAAFQVPVALAPGEAVMCAFVLGEAEGASEVPALLARYRSAAAIERALEAVQTFWRETMAGVQVKTPAPALDLMMNGWLPYQNLSCRLWGRSAYYQSGGAFGFRDQLQDAAALVYLQPALTRAQILLHAAHQFAEGDVMHWWHPPTSKGIRTRFSDDLLWLPFVTTFYVRATGDASVLDEQARFLTGRMLEEGEDEIFLFPRDAGVQADVYEHCCRALDRSLTRGAHGLPLMGTGDWNDGMNRVGRGGRGESVWVGFFLYDILHGFIPLCEARGDAGRAARYAAYRSELAEVLNDAGWDGAWYRRAYYDDGTPLGSAQNDECRIDALAQAWAVLSKAAPPERARQALDALEEHLVVEDEGLIRLLAPAFDKTPHDPGYIKGYLPGVRENGGQYTHAALWAVRALAEAGRRNRAARLLEMLSPVSHARTPEEVATYQVEPYVIAADVYGVAPHVGRGGWTWYTGSAGWMYRVALESILGLRIEEGRRLVLSPCIPDDWPEFALQYRLPDGRTTYAVHVSNPERHAAVVRAVTVDGAPSEPVAGAARILLQQDGATHHVHVLIGRG